MKSFTLRVAVVAAVLSSSGCHLLLGRPIACEPADEATCPTEMHCAAGACVDGAPRCGDGDVTGAEVCDDGNDVDIDACSNQCAVNASACGNTVVEGNEACDDGNDVQDDACANDCTLNCGNGTREGAEACDDGNDIDDDDCSNACTDNVVAPECGNGTREGNEACDDGNTIDDDACSNACSESIVDPLCGNGSLDGQEACDDGNTIDNDVCANDCTLNPNCGNGQIDLGEECDENAQETATCTGLCTLALFNNGRIDPGLGEACDDGNDNPDDFCHDGVIGNVTSCADIQQGGSVTGAYAVDIDGAGPLAPVTVHCNMDVDGGGWTRVLLTNTDLAIAQLPEGNTSSAGRLSTLHVAALARRSQQVHIRTLDNEARSVTSVLEALPVDRLRLGASLAPVQRGYPLVQVNAEWSGPFVSRLAASTAPTHTAWPDVYEAAGNAQGLQLFDNGTQLVSRWEGNTNEPIEVWLRPQAVCGDGVLQGLENCDDGNAITADGCSRCRSDNCADGASSAAQLPAIGERTMVHSADLDDDGFKDVMVVELVSNTPTVSVARGSAFGLQRAVPVVLANMPDALADPVVGGVGGSDVLDVDGDDVLDLVLFDQFNCTFQVFRGTGAGAFTAPIQSPALDVGTGVCGDGDVSASSRRTHLGAFLDVDGDSLLDAVLPASDGALRVVFQQQGGQFVTNPAQLTIAVGNARCTPQQVIAADLTGLGQAQSLVVTCRMVTESEQQILIVLEQGPTGFTRHELPVDAHLTDVVTGDLNNDGFDDLIGTGTKAGGQRVTRVLRNDRSFVFTTSASHNGNGDRVAVNDEGTALGLGVVGGTAFLRVAIGAGATSLLPQSSSGPVVSDYAAPAFVDADGIPGSEYISAADGTVFIERQGNTCQVTP